jgi:hypothetical protein
MSEKEIEALIAHDLQQPHRKTVSRPFGRETAKEKEELWGEDTAVAKPPSKPDIDLLDIFMKAIEHEEKEEAS